MIPVRTVRNIIQRAGIILGLFRLGFRGSLGIDRFLPVQASFFKIIVIFLFRVEPKYYIFTSLYYYPIYQ